MSLEGIRADAIAHQKRLSELRKRITAEGRAAGPGTWVAELAENVYPLLVAILSEVDEEVSELSGVVDELVDRTESSLQPELAAQILAVFEAGKQVCAELDAAVADADDVRRKRCSDLTKAYRAAADMTAGLLDAVTIQYDDDADATDDADDSDDTEAAPDEDDDLAAAIDGEEGE